MPLKSLLLTPEYFSKEQCDFLRKMTRLEIVGVSPSVFDRFPKEDFIYKYRSGFTWKGPARK
jgi:hypothetical protein